MNLLIVDDRRGDYSDFERNLSREHRGIEIRAAPSAIEALEVFADCRCDIVVLDQHMGGGDKDGTAFLRGLRDRHPGEKVPEIIFVTAYYDDLPIGEILRLGVPIALFLEKDASFQEMLLIATQLVIRRLYGEVRYDPKDLFGEDFIELILAEVNEVISREHLGYRGVTQQRQIGTLIRSYISSLRMRSRWNADDVLELSIFFAESLSKVFRLPRDLIEVLRRFLNVEEILYTIPYYRDHFFHQIKVFLLGFCIINTLNRDGRLGSTILSGPDGMKVWFTTAAFHDIGYPFEKMARWLENFVEGVLRSPGDPAENTIIPMMFHWGALLGRRFHAYHLECIVREICRQYEKETPQVVADLLSEITSYVVGTPDHGLYSSLIIQNFLRYKVSDAELDPVSAAVALHNEDIAECVKQAMGEPQTFERNPLSFLLAYCDLAQDWGRIRPAGARQSGYGLFGYPVFACSQVYDPSTHTVCVVLRYDRALTVIERHTWHADIYTKHIQPMKTCWQVSVKGWSELGFYIEYQTASEDDPVLARLVF